MTTAQIHDIQWQRGQFLAFRATRDVALPEIDGVPQPGLKRNEPFEFDGTILRREGEDERKIPQLRGCFTKQWIVLASDRTTQYVARPAGVQVHAATQMGNDPRRGATMAVTSEDMAEVGKIGQRIQRRQAPGNAVAQRVEAASSRPAAPKAARMTVLARQLIREMDLLAQKFGVRRSPEPSLPEQPPREESFLVTEPEPPRRKFTVDRDEHREVGPARPNRAPEPEPQFNTQVHVTGGGEAIRNLGAVVTDGGGTFAGADQPASQVQVGSGHTPRQVTAAQSGMGQARAGRRMMVVEAGDDGVAIGAIGSAKKEPFDITNAGATQREIRSLDGVHGAPPKRTKFTVVADEQEDQQGEVVGVVGDAGETPELTVVEALDGEPQEIELADFEPDEGDPIEAAASAVAKEVSEEERFEPPPEFAAKLAAVRMWVPRFQWDITLHWKVRVRNAMRYKDQPNWLKGILIVEQPDVQRHIKAALEKVGVEL